MSALFDLTEHSNVASAHPRKLHLVRFSLFVLFGCLTATLLFIIAYWHNPLLDLIFVEPRDPSLIEYILIVYKNGEYRYVATRRVKGRKNPYKDPKRYMVFELEGSLYTFSQKKQIFRPIKDKFRGYLRKHIKSLGFFSRGLSTSTVQQVRRFYGKNKIKIERKFLGFVFLEYFLMPVNFYQFSIGVGFFLLNRVVYTIMVFCYIGFIVLFKTYEYSVNIRKLKEISNVHAKVLVQRRVGNETITRAVASKNLVIGDVVVVEPQTKFTCDMVLIEGSCLVNEAMLTGESIPVSKTPIDLTKRGHGFDSKSILSSGTFVIFNRSKRVLALVVGTGWNTTKGELLNPIVFTDKSRLKFENDFLLVLFYLFVGNLALLSIMIGYELINGTFAVKKDFPKILQFFKSAYPPSVYFIAMASLQISAYKLRQKGVNSLRIEKIVEGGVIGTICYDKTGTITESSLKMFGFVTTDDGQFQEYQTDLHSLIYHKRFRELVTTMSCCHTLIKFNDRIYGDPLEEQMFKSTGSLLNAEEMTGKRKGIFRVDFSREYKKLFHSSREWPLRILKVNEFTSERRLMSVVVQNDETGEIGLLVKGAPEAVVLICGKGSIPPNFEDTLTMYNEQGLRTLAIGYKVIRKGERVPESTRNLPAAQTRRDSIRSLDNVALEGSLFEETETSLEQNVDFLGLLLFENPLKEGTLEAILDLKSNRIRQLMITGDNVYTAVSVAYSCGLVDKNQSMFLAIFNPNSKKIEFVDFNAEDRLESQKLARTVEGGSNPSQVSSRLLRSSVRNIRTFNLLENAIASCRSENRRIAVEATSFEHLWNLTLDRPQLQEELLDYIVVFGRSSASQKEMIVGVYREISKKKEEYVAFVGDGSNDCRALKAAHVGLSIGNDEASFAASFISSKLTIAPVIDLIIEGKVCLANAFQNFKSIMLSTYVIIFSIFVLNFMKLEIARYDYVYLFIFNFPLAFLMSTSASRERLTVFRQSPTLRSIEILGPMMVEVCVSFVLLVTVALLLGTSPQYKPVPEVVPDYDPAKFDVNEHYFVENKLFLFFSTALMIVNCFNAYRGFPYKVGFFTNPLLVIYNLFLIAFILFNVFIEAIADGEFLRQYVRIIRVPVYQQAQLKNFCLNAVLLLVFFALLSHVVEKVILYKKIKTLSKLNAVKPGELVVQAAPKEESKEVTQGN